MFSHFYNQLMSVKLNTLDKIAIGIYIAAFAVMMIIGNLGVLTVGGMILIGGAFFVYKGKIFVSVMWYLIADFCWVINAYYADDIQGAIFVTVGVILSLIATVKMHTGKMESELAHKEEDENSNN